MKRIAGDGAYRAFNESLEDEGLERAGSKGVDASTYLVSQIGQNTRPGRGLASLFKPNPLEESPVYRLKRFGSSLVGNYLSPPNSHCDIIPSLIRIFDSAAKLKSGAKDALEIVSKIDFEKCCPPLSSLWPC